MTVHRLAVTLGSLYLGHHLLVAIQHTEVVHHLCQETNILTGHQGLRVLDVNYLATGLDVAAYCRHTAGGTEEEIETGLLTRAYHVIDTVHAQHIANLVRIGHDTYRAVAHGNACKLMRNHHTALDVYVSINETRHNIRPGGLTLWQRTALHLYYLLVFYDQFAVVYLPTNHVNYMSFYVFHKQISIAVALRATLYTFRLKNFFTFHFSFFTS